jgi:hypothetical protein
MNRETKIKLIGMIVDAFLTDEQASIALSELDELYDQATTDAPLDVEDLTVLEFMKIAVFIIHQGGSSEEENQAAH